MVFKLLQNSGIELALNREKRAFIVGFTAYDLEEINK